MGRSSGFTYIELVFVVLIIGIIATLGHTAYSTLHNRKQVEVQTGKVAYFIDLARTKTQANETNCETYEGQFSVVIDADSPATLSLVPAGCPAETTYTLPDGFSLPEGSMTISQQPFGTGINAPACIIVQHIRSDYCGLVTVTQAGAIDQEVSTSCTC